MKTKVIRRVFLPIAGILITMVATIAFFQLESTPRDEKKKSISVAAAEVFWGNLAEQLGGDKVAVESILSSAGIDPHEYEATVQDATILAKSHVAIINGLGFDPWAEKALVANPSSMRKVVDVGEVLGLKLGDNPHRWYSAEDVKNVVYAIVDTYKKVDSKNATYYEEQRDKFLSEGLQDYTKIQTSLKNKYAHAKVGATESIFEPLAKELGLQLLTPSTLLTAISEGNEITVEDREIMIKQIKNREIGVLVYNQQNATPDIQFFVKLANESGVEVVSISEVPLPTTMSWQQWQTKQLEELQQALQKAASLKE